MNDNWTQQHSKVGQERKGGGRRHGERERKGGGEIISAVYVLSASRPPLANRTGGHLN